MPFMPMSGSRRDRFYGIAGVTGIGTQFATECGEAVGDQLKEIKK